MQIKSIQVMANKPIELVIDAPSLTPKTNIPNQTSSILAKFHAGYFRISISFCSQALLWKILTDHSTDFDSHTYLLHLFHMLPKTFPLMFWHLSLFILFLLSLIYILKCWFHFDTVKEEFVNPLRCNYFFAPWISCLLLLQSAPNHFFVSNSAIHQVLYWVFVTPIILLDLKIYGQWFTAKKRFLSVMANPTCQMSVIGNLVGAGAAARMGWGESAVCLFSLGMSHYVVVFITLYQRLSGGESLPAKLHPVFFLFIAAPCMASFVWSSISGTFDTSSKMLFFLSLFLFVSLVCRPVLFKKSTKRLTVAWWAYSFPLTFLALASAEYTQEVKTHAASLLMFTLSALSVLVLLGLVLFTVLNTYKLLNNNAPNSNFGKDESGMKTKQKQKPCLGSN